MSKTKKVVSYIPTILWTRPAPYRSPGSCAFAPPLLPFSAGLRMSVKMETCAVQMDMANATQQFRSAIVDRVYVDFGGRSGIVVEHDLRFYSISVVYCWTYRA